MTQPAHPLRESEVLRDPLRAQLPTHRHGPDPYFATLHLPEQPPRRVFVKGPYTNADHAHHQRVTDALKPLLEPPTRTPCLLPDAGVELLTLLPERGHLPQRAPVPAEPSLFVIMRDLCDTARGGTRLASSRTFSPMQVFDKATSRTRPIAPDTIAPESLAALGTLAALAFRYALEINDTCSGNILVDHDTQAVYSIDENSCLGGPRPHLFKRPPSRAWAAWLDAALGYHRAAIADACARWADTCATSEAIAALLATLGESPERVVGHFRSVASPLASPPGPLSPRCGEGGA